MRRVWLGLFGALFAGACFAQGLSGGGAGFGPANLANPSATCGPTAVNGTASTAMRSDGAPACQKGTNAQFGLVEGDNSSITCVVGVCSVKPGIANIFTPPLCASFGTTINGGSGSPAPSCTDDSSVGLVLNVGQLAASNQVRGFCQAVPNAAFTATMGARADVSVNESGSIGMFATDGTKFAGPVYTSTAASAGDAAFRVDDYTNLTTYSNSNILPAQRRGWPLWVRFVTDGTTISIWTSSDGTYWALEATAVQSTYIGTITQICIAGSAYSNDTGHSNATLESVFYWNVTHP